MYQIVLRFVSIEGRQGAFSESLLSGSNCRVIEYQSQEINWQGGDILYC